MELVVDASILAESLRLEQSHVRAWITDLLDGDRMYVIAGLTVLEVTSALRKLVMSDLVTERSRP